MSKLLPALGGVQEFFRGGAGIFQSNRKAFEILIVSILWNL